jgi:hypothetical protein
MSLAKGIFSWRTFRALIFIFVALVTLVLVVIAFENWRGKRAWLKFKTEWESKGETFDIASAIPPKVPDHENFGMIPFFAPLFDYEYAPSVTHKNSNAVLRTQSVFLGSRGRLRNIGARQQAKRTDLKEWQEYFAGNTNYPSGDRTQSAAGDVLHALSKYDDVISELRTASMRPHSHYPVHYHEGFSALLPHLSVLRGVSEIARLRAVAELRHGRTNEAFADLKLSLYLAESLKSEPLLISQLVRIALLGAALDTVWETLDGWSDVQMTELQQTLSRIDVLEDYPKSIRGERAFSNDTFARMRRGENFPGELEVAARYGPSGLLYQNQLTINRLHQKYVLAPVDVESRKVDVPKALALDDLPELKGWHLYRLFAKLLFPALSKAVVRFARAQTDIDLAVIACALERHHRLHGQYPASLEELRPKFIEKIPNDVVSGGPLRYSREAADSFTLYAVGFDEKDNDGKAPPAKERRVDLAGYDWVWQPAPKPADNSSNR